MMTFLSPLDALIPKMLVSFFWPNSGSGMYVGRWHAGEELDGRNIGCGDLKAALALLNLLPAPAHCSSVIHTVLCPLVGPNVR